MHIANLRSVGGSVMMAIPKALLDTLGLAANNRVGLTVDDGRLVVAPAPKKRYSLDELIAQCDASAPLSAEDAAWLDEPAVGQEAL